MSHQTPQPTLGMDQDQMQRLQSRLRTARDLIQRLKPPADRDVLVHVRAGAEPEQRELAERLVVGRDPAADWRVEDARLSRRHFELVRTQHGIALHDLGSQNRTRVNGVVTTTRTLASGDLIQAGDQTFILLARLDLD